MRGSPLLCMCSEYEATASSRFAYDYNDKRKVRVKRWSRTKPQIDFLHFGLVRLNQCALQHAGKALWVGVHVQ